MNLKKDLANADLLVVGSGFFGATIAERAANLYGKKVVVIDRRDHIAGNAYSYFEPETGVEVHKYGSHIFHTNNEKVWNYINSFSGFNHYEHRVFSISNGKIYQLPFNLFTLSQLSERYINPLEAEEQYRMRPQVKAYRNLEEKAIEMVGVRLYEKLIKGYTFKQWQTDPKNLPDDIISRIPVRLTFDSRYFDDKYQGLPLCGYTELVKRMLDSKRISVHLETDFRSLKHEIDIPVVYSGPIDEYFDFSEGHLSWRTIDLEFQTFDTQNYQGTAVMNYADLDVPFTRIHEFRFLHPERDYQQKTVIAREFSRASGPNDEPYYPVNSEKDREILNRYRNLSQQEKGIIFGGRLGSYKYLDMHMAIASALQISETKLKDLLNK